MSLQIQHPVAEWYLQFDDLWELMRVNWQKHNPFTQNGMWDVSPTQRIVGVPMVVDTPPYRGVLLSVQNDDMDSDYMIVTTYGPKCAECGYQPYDALGLGDEDPDLAIRWAAATIVDLFRNAEEGGVDKLHSDGCSHLTYDEAEDG